jgi:hypothetical protein
MKHCLVRRNFMIAKADLHLRTRSHVVVGHSVVVVADAGLPATNAARGVDGSQGRWAH